MKDQLLNFSGLTELVNNMKEYFSKYVSENKVMSFPSVSSFPTVGNKDMIYIDTTHDTIYRWDDTSIKYYPLAFNTDDLYILDCNSDD